MWAKWLVAALLGAGTVIALFLLVGSIAWPEPAAAFVVIGYLTFTVLEVLTWRRARLADGTKRKSGDPV